MIELTEAEARFIEHLLRKQAEYTNTYLPARLTAESALRKIQAAFPTAP